MTGAERSSEISKVSSAERTKIEERTPRIWSPGEIQILRI